MFNVLFRNHVIFESFLKYAVGKSEEHIENFQWILIFLNTNNKTLHTRNIAEPILGAATPF